MHSPNHKFYLLPAILTLMLIAAPKSASAYNWLQFNGDPQHSGSNTQEKLIDARSVKSLKLLFRIKLPGIADGSPVYLSSVKTRSGPKDLLFVTTREGHIIALDARSGSEIWKRSYPAGSCRINKGALPCYTTSSPAIDPDLEYVYSYGLDGCVHKLRVADGEETIGGGWPEPATLKPFDEKGSSALSIATARNGVSYLYVVSSGYLGDMGDYQGHLTAINLADGSQKVFNALCSNISLHFKERPERPDCPHLQAGIWARAGVLYSPDTDRIYIATGNGLFDPARFCWGDSVFSLNPDGTGSDGKPLDSYTPLNYQRLDVTDKDLGSTAPAVLPVRSSDGARNLLIQGGKDSKLRLLNPSNLSGKGGPGHTGGEIAPLLNLPQGGVILTAPALWVEPKDGNTWVFIANSRGICGLKLEVKEGKPPMLEVAWKSSKGGTSPVVANGVLFYARSGKLRALDPATGKELWRNSRIGPIHWQSPVVVNGAVYISDEGGHLTAFSPGGGRP